jgi:hypothetical protein
MPLRDIEKVHDERVKGPKYVHNINVNCANISKQYNIANANFHRLTPATPFSLTYGLEARLPFIEPVPE